MSLTLETVSDEAAFAGLAGEWDDLVRAMPRPSPFLLHGWLLEWWRHRHDRAVPTVQLARREGRLVAALPLEIAHRRGLRVAQFPGGDRFALGDVLLAPGEDTALVARIAERVRSGHDYADLFGLPGGSRLADVVTMIARVESPVLDLGPGWEAIYRSKLAGKHRTDERRKRRRLAEAGPVESATARTWDELEPALDEAFRIHELRWRGRPDGSGFATDASRHFHRAATRALAELDAARITALAVGGETIAFSYSLVVDKRLYSYRIGFDPTWARFSPGYLNSLDMVQSACAEGLARVEFLGGAEEYKVQLADRFEPLYEGFGLAGTARGRAAAAAAVALGRARGRLRRSPAIRRVVREVRARRA